MDLKEAIIHTRQVAEGCGVDSRDCAYQHYKLGDWLEELQAYHSIGTTAEFHTLKEADQKRREGCEFCAEKCNVCSVQNAFSACIHCADSYNFDSEKFCKNCGRDLRGERRDD